MSKDTKADKNKREQRKTGRFFNLKMAAVIVSILFFLSLLPVIYVGLFNYATGDDYWYGVHTYRGWVEGGLLSALMGSFKTVAEFYQNWQGTWFTMFLFTLSPNHFWENGYIITVFLALGCLLFSYSYLADYFLVKKLGFGREITAILVCLISYLSIQYIPRTTSGIYWFNGIMHYSVPFLLACLAIVHSHKFMDTGRKRDYIILFLSFTLLGGGSYLAPIAATLTVVLMLVFRLRIEEWDWRNRSLKWSFDVRNLWILAALLAQLAGLAVSFLAPGNNVRGGEEFGFDLKWIFQCIVYAIDRGIYLGEDYFLLNGVTTVVYLLIAIVLWYQMWKIRLLDFNFPLPLLFVIFTNGIYWAVYTPEIYSRSDVSGGVPNTYFHIFLLVTFSNMVYVHGWLQKKLLALWEKKATETEKTVEEIRAGSLLYKNKFGKYILLPGVIAGIAAFLLISEYDSLNTTNDYCMDYIRSGELQVYRSIRIRQHEILSDEAVVDAVVPEITARYPLLNMELEADITASRNVDRAGYYNKNSVRAEKVE